MGAGGTPSFTLGARPSQEDRPRSCGTVLPSVDRGSGASRKDSHDLDVAA